MIARLLRPSVMPAINLQPGEALLWQSSPAWRRVVLDVFHLPMVLLYLALLIVANGVSARLQHLSPAATWHASLPLWLACVAVLMIVLAIAHLNWRSIHYTITTDRVVLRYGVALAGTLSIPHRAIGEVSVALHKDHAGDIPLRLRPGHSVSLLKTWPLVRPWRLQRAEPMLRGVPQAGPVATILARTVAQVNNRPALVPAMAEAAD